VTLDLPPRAHSLAPEHWLALTCAAASGVNDLGFCGDLTRAKESERERLGSYRTATCWAVFGADGLDVRTGLDPTTGSAAGPVAWLLPLHCVVCFIGQCFRQGNRSNRESNPPTPTTGGGEKFGQGALLLLCCETAHDRTLLLYSFSCFCLERFAWGYKQRPGKFTLFMRTWCTAFVHMRGPAGSFWREHECQGTEAPSRSAGTRQL
jgi:hypothetical protein